MGLKLFWEKYSTYLVTEYSVVKKVCIVKRKVCRQVLFLFLFFTSVTVYTAQFPWAMGWRKKCPSIKSSTHILLWYLDYLNPEFQKSILRAFCVFNWGFKGPFLFLHISYSLHRTVPLSGGLQKKNISEYFFLNGILLLKFARCLRSLEQFIQAVW